MDRTCIHNKLTTILLLLSLFVLADQANTNTETTQQKKADTDDIDYDRLPPILDSNDIAYFFERNEITELHDILKHVFDKSKRNPKYDNPRQQQQELQSTLVARGGGDTYTTAHKLEHDIEQATYLATYGEKDEIRTMFQNNVLPIYRAVFRNIPSLEELQRTYGLYAFTSQDYDRGIETVYNKALHITDYDTLRDNDNDDGKPIPLLNPNLDITDIERQWQQKQQQHDDDNNDDDDNGGNSDDDGAGAGTGTGAIVVVDDLLRPRALQKIRQLLLESTVWYQTKMPLKFGSYNGAYIDDGLYDLILLELARELYQTFPTIFENHPLKYMWAYKYDSNTNTSGIHIHADQAAVNVNIWLTPNDANLDPTSGGLVVYTAKPPTHWDFELYNTNTELVREQLLRPTMYANVTIPYRYNRAVIFDSALFHHSDEYKFKGGYEHRRINLTFLYGDMQKATSTTTTTSASARAAVAAESGATRTSRQQSSGTPDEQGDEL